MTPEFGIEKVAVDVLAYLERHRETAVRDEAATAREVETALEPARAAYSESELPQAYFAALEAELRAALPAAWRARRPAVHGARDRGVSSHVNVTTEKRDDAIIKSAVGSGPKELKPRHLPPLAITSDAIEIRRSSASVSIESGPALRSSDSILSFERRAPRVARSGRLFLSGDPEPARRSNDRQ
jgi:hypothetical protein